MDSNNLPRMCKTCEPDVGCTECGTFKWVEASPAAPTLLPRSCDVAQRSERHQASLRGALQNPLPLPINARPPALAPHARRYVRMNVLNNNGGQLEYNRCSTCNNYLGCKSPYDCATPTNGGLPGCTQCSTGRYFKPVDIAVVGGTKQYIACGSCIADFNCPLLTSCDATSEGPPGPTVLRACIPAGLHLPAPC